MEYFPRNFHKESSLLLYSQRFHGYDFIAVENGDERK